MTNLTPKQMTELITKAQAEIIELRKQAQATNIEMDKLKESESVLKQQLSDKSASSKIKIGTPFSSIIRNLNFDDFITPKKKRDVIEINENDSNENNNEKDNSGTAILLALMQEIKKINEKMAKVPGAPLVLEDATPESFADSPFVDTIAKAEMPRKFVPPNMKAYDGTTDPVEHISLYKHRIEASSIPANKKEICMCKGFGTTLTGAALTWYMNIPLRSVKCFADLVNLFITNSLVVEHYKNEQVTYIELNKAVLRV